jgi:hypothetical protein
VGYFRPQSSGSLHSAVEKSLKYNFQLIRRTDTVLEYHAPDAELGLHIYKANDNATRFSEKKIFADLVIRPAQQVGKNHPFL